MKRMQLTGQKLTRLELKKMYGGLSDDDGPEATCTAECGEGRKVTVKCPKCRAEDMIGVFCGKEKLPRNAC